MADISAPSINTRTSLLKSAKASSPFFFLCICVGGTGKLFKPKTRSFRPTLNIRLAFKNHYYYIKVSDIPSGNKLTENDMISSHVKIYLHKWGYRWFHWYQVCLLLWNEIFAYFFILNYWSLWSSDSEFSSLGFGIAHTNFFSSFKVGQFESKCATFRARSKYAN